MPTRASNFDAGSKNAVKKHKWKQSRIDQIHPIVSPTHRCVLASCSPWFDSRLKMHKTLKEQIDIDCCQNLEAFYAVLTYCYTGQILIDRGSVGELLYLSDFFGISKLKAGIHAEVVKHSVGIWGGEGPRTPPGRLKFTPPPPCGQRPWV